MGAPGEGAGCAFCFGVSLYCGDGALSTATTTGVSKKICEGPEFSEFAEGLCYNNPPGNLGKTKGGETFENPAYADDQVQDLAVHPDNQLRKRRSGFGPVSTGERRLTSSQK